MTNARVVGVRVRPANPRLNSDEDAEIDLVKVEGEGENSLSTGERNKTDVSVLVGVLV